MPHVVCISWKHGYNIPEHFFAFTLMAYLQMLSLWVLNALKECNMFGNNNVDKIIAILHVFCLPFAASLLA